MNEKKNYEAGFGSNATKDPQRIVFITKKTSAKVKGDVGPQLMSFPHVILREAIAFQILTIVLVANPLLTPNPAKAPWYFLGLQELLHYFPPVVAGVLIPTLIVVALVVIPYFNVNSEGVPLWFNATQRRFWIFAVVLVVLLLFFGFYQAWTVIVPTVVIAGLALISRFLQPGRGRSVEFLRTRTLPWWVMTWFIAVAIVLTEVGTYFRGPGWSWVWPWR
jgi:hypothetical protein